MINLKNVLNESYLMDNDEILMKGIKYSKNDIKYNRVVLRINYTPPRRQRNASSSSNSEVLFCTLYA